MLNAPKHSDSLTTASWDPRVNAVAKGEERCLCGNMGGVRPAPSGCHRMAVGGAAQPAAEEGSESTVCYHHSAGRAMVLPVVC